MKKWMTSLTVLLLLPIATKALDDGSVYRSAILSGRDSTYVYEIPADLVKKGENTVALNMWGVGEKGLGGILYDCIKLEAGRKEE